jgi:hypothetical protein
MKERIIKAIKETRAHSVERAHRIENIVDSAFAGIDYPIDIYCEDLRSSMDWCKEEGNLDFIEWAAEDLEKAIDNELSFYRQYEALNNQNKEDNEQ